MPEKPCFLFSFCERHGFASVRSTTVPLGKRKKRQVFSFVFHFLRGTVFLPREARRTGKNCVFSFFFVRGTVLLAREAQLCLLETEKIRIFPFREGHGFASARGMAIPL